MTGNMNHSYFFVCLAHLHLFAVRTDSYNSFLLLQQKVEVYEIPSSNEVS